MSRCLGDLLGHAECGMPDGPDGTSRVFVGDIENEGPTIWGLCWGP